MVFFGGSLIAGIISRICDSKWQWTLEEIEITFCILLVALIPLFIFVIRRRISERKLMKQIRIKEEKLMELGAMPFIPMSEVKYGKLYDKFGAPLEKSFERCCREIMSGKGTYIKTITYIVAVNMMKSYDMVVSLDGYNYPKVCQDEFEKWLESLHHNGDLTDSDIEDIKTFGDKIESLAEDIKKPEKKLCDVAMLIYKGTKTDGIRKYFGWTQSRTNDAVRQLMELGIVSIGTIGDRPAPCRLKESVYKEIVKTMCGKLGIDYSEPIED